MKDFLVKGLSLFFFLRLHFQELNFSGHPPGTVEMLELSLLA